MVSFNWFDPDNICRPMMTLSCARELCGAAAQLRPAVQYRLCCTGIRFVKEEKKKKYAMSGRSDF
jgi:hypothetical protein